MRKIFLAALMVIAVCSESFAVSQDMGAYVRQDVFDAKMEMLFMRLHGEIENLGTRLEGKIDALDKKIDGEMETLSARLDNVEKDVSYAIRIRDIIMYVPLIFLFAILFMIYASIFLNIYRERRTPAVTLDDVRRIVAEAIAENSAKVRG